MSPSRPNILFLLSDQHSYRYFPGTSDASHPVHTPTFDGLVANATVFARAYCAAPVCTPSRLSMLTGRRAWNAGAWTNGSMLRPGLPTIAEVLSDGGYETCLLGKMHLGGDRQFAGFDQRPYGDLTGQGSHQLEQAHFDLSDLDIARLVRDAGVTGFPESVLQEQNVAQEALSFVREHRAADPDQPYFLCASFGRPHWPRTAPERHLDRYWPDGVGPPDVEQGNVGDHPLLEVLTDRFADLTDEEVLRARAGYFACVSYLDEIIGDLFARLRADGLLENTIVVYASDHGEFAGEYGLWEKFTWHDSAARVPLAIQMPEHRAGGGQPTTMSTPVSLIDLFPTFCGFGGLDAPADIDGVDLSDAIRNGREPERAPVTIESFIPFAEGVEYRMQFDGRYKFVHFRDAPDLLFDLEADPGERRNLLEANAEAVPDAAAALQRRVEHSIDFSELESRRDRDRRRREEHRLGIPRGTANQYVWPDGRVIDADTPLYHPHVIAEDPDVVFDDAPGQE